MALYIGDTLISGEIEGQKLNLPFTLFQYQFTDHILNNASWLRADTFSWASGAVYVSAYEHLVDDIDNITAETETIAGYTVTFYRATDGHKICLADQESTVADIFTATGVAWYYILDTANQRFKLPLELPFDGQAKGNGMTLGLTDGTTNYGTTGATYNADRLVGTSNDYGRNVGVATNNGIVPTLVVGITTDPTKSGIILNRNNTDSQKYLYFYVGETIQDANLINAGAVLDDINDLKAHYIVETYVNGTSWYRVYSDGWCEQGGISSSVGAEDIALLKPYRDTNGTVLVTPATINVPSSSDGNPIGGFVNASTIRVCACNSYSPAYWVAYGYIN